MYLWGARWSPHLTLPPSWRSDHFFFFNSRSFIYLFIYLFMTVLSLRFYVRAFSSRGKWGPLFIAVRGPLTIGLSCYGAQAPDAQAQQLWLTGPVAPRHVGSSQTRARTRVPCIGRQTPNHCATREAQVYILLKKLDENHDILQTYRKAQQILFKKKKSIYSPSRLNEKKIIWSNLLQTFKK